MVSIPLNVMGGIYGVQGRRVDRRGLGEHTVGGEQRLAIALVGTV